MAARAKRILGGLCLAAALFVLGGGACMIHMPGKSHSGSLPELDAAGGALAEGLRRDVQRLAGEIGDRNVLTRPAALDEAAGYLRAQLESLGYSVANQGFEVRARQCWNLEAARPGGREVVVVGAHYDSVPDCPGANDNASGTAALLALARAFAGRRTQRTLRFVAFVNEEPPWFQTEAMGSLVYARACRERGDQVVAMLSLETMGYYSDAAGSQVYPFPFRWFYPDTGNFIAFVGNLGSMDLVRRCVGLFRGQAAFPSEGAAVPGFVPGVGWSDHWSFWQVGYPGVMVTDTAPFRYPHYHTAADTPDKLDYERLARVVAGLEGVVAELAGAH